MTTAEQLQALHAEVTVTGTLSCIDNGGARPLTPDEFHDIVGRIADHLDGDSRIADPSVWGQAAGGDMEIYFLLPEVAGPPALNGQIADIIRRMGEAVGLIWANDSTPPTRRDAAPMLAQKSQRCDLVPAPA